MTAAQTNKEQNRKTGIEILGDIPWGVHFCLFYQNKEDLMDILVPYFKAGLENNEFCMWVTSEPLNAQDAKEALQCVVKNLDDYIEKGQIEILDYGNWYTKSGRFEADEVLQGWVQKHDQAIEKAFDGLRLTGNTFWLTKRGWEKFVDYETVVNNVIDKYKMLAICTYSLDKCNASEILDVVSSHQFALIKREGVWEIIESAECKKASHALYESEGRYRSLTDEALNSSAVGIIILDADFKIVWANQALQRYFGLLGDEVVGRDKRQLIRERIKHIFAEPDLFCEKVLATYDNNTYIENFECHVLADGKREERWLEHRSQPIGTGFYTGGRIEHYYDITKLKKSEEAIRESERRFRQLFDSSRDGILVADRQSREYIMCNKAICDMLGYSEDELKRLGLKDLHLEEELSQHIAQFDQLSQEMIAKVENVAVKRKDGSIFYADIAASLVTLGGKKYLMGSFRDITERKNAEEEMRQNRERLFQIIQGSSVPTFVINDKHFVTHWNKACEELTCISANEMIGTQKQWSAFYSEERPVMADLIVDSAQDEEVARNYEGKHRRSLLIEGAYEGEDFFPDLGEEGKWLFFTAAPLRDANGRPIGAIETLQDITERKKAEEAMEQLNRELQSAVQQLNRSNRELKDFAHVIAHDLKAPLRAIASLADWIATDYADKFDRRGKEQINSIMGRAERISALIDGILRYSEIGRSAQKKQEVNLNTVVANVIVQITPPENIEITIENDLPMVTCEEARLMQVFQNLIGNAIKYMDKPKGRIRIACVEEDNVWKFSVNDNGPGIQEEYFERIFEMFQTLSPRDELEGTGIGLTIVKKIVELYGGKVWLESEVGQGTTFFFTLPKEELGVRDAQLQADFAR